MRFGQTFHFALSSGHLPSQIHHCVMCVCFWSCHHGKIGSLWTESRMPQVEVMSGEEGEGWWLTSLTVCRGMWSCREWDHLANVHDLLDKAVTGDTTDLFVVLAGVWRDPVLPTRAYLDLGNWLRGVRGRQPFLQSQPQTGYFLICQTLRLYPSHLLVPFIQHRLVCSGPGVSKTRGCIPKKVQVSSWTTDYCVTLCKSVPLSRPHVLGPEDSNLPAALVFHRKIRIHTCEGVAGSAPLEPLGSLIPNTWIVTDQTCLHLYGVE